jgi:hypothetical protein
MNMIGGRLQNRIAYALQHIYIERDLEYCIFWVSGYLIDSVVLNGLGNKETQNPALQLGHSFSESDCCVFQSLFNPPSLHLLLDLTEFHPKFPKSRTSIAVLYDWSHSSVIRKWGVCTYKNNCFWPVCHGCLLNKFVFEVI